MKIKLIHNEYNLRIFTLNLELQSVKRKRLWVTPTEFKIVPEIRNEFCTEFSLSTIICINLINILSKIITGKIGHLCQGTHSIFMEL